MVPVNNDTISEWTYLPYSGHFDGASDACDLVVFFDNVYSNYLGEYIWGRGSTDDKSALISSLSVDRFLDRAMIDVSFLVSHWRTFSNKILSQDVPSSWSLVLMRNPVGLSYVFRHGDLFAYYILDSIYFSLIGSAIYRQVLVKYVRRELFRHVSR